MRGRKPKPTTQQLAEGDPRKRGKRKLEGRLNAEAKAARGLPECPERLTGVAREQWELWREELEAMKLDCRPDGAALEGACVNFARAVQAEELLTRQGITVEEPIVSRETGEVLGMKIKNHPAEAIAQRRWMITRSFCSEFGLSPVSRTRLPANNAPKDGEDDLMELLNKPRTPRQQVIN